MARIDMDPSGSILVALQTEADVAQLRAAMKAADGADEVPLQTGRSTRFDRENPFNFIALWATDFSWSPEALQAALDCLVPVAQSSVTLHRRSHARMMRRMTSGMAPSATPERSRPAE